MAAADRAHECASLVLLLLAATVVGSDAQDWSGWSTGRATFYGGLNDPWSIHHGSCGYGYLDEYVGTGWDVAAAADTNWDYSQGCGRCLEVACNPTSFSDGYGQWMDRSNVCRDTSASVVVQITDSCPCDFAANYYSNKRWCCGDMYHLDLSVWAFEKLAEKMWGVIGIRFRSVDCHTKPWKEAWLPLGESPSPGAGPDSGWQHWFDKRPDWWNFNYTTGSSESTPSFSYSSSGSWGSSDSSGSSNNWWSNNNNNNNNNYNNNNNNNWQQYNDGK